MRGFGFTYKPKIEAMNIRPSIIISIEPHLADFLRREFFVNKNGEVLLSRRNDIGKMIASVVLTSDLPVKRPFCKHPLTLILPVTKNNHYVLSTRYLHVSQWGEEKIQDFVSSEFRRRVRDMFELGYKKHYPQKQIIEGILRGYNLRDNALNFDMIKKIDYRNSVNFRKSVFSDIQNADY